MSLSCNKRNNPTEDSIVDCNGTEFSFENTPERVVCLQASLGSIWNLAGGTYVGISNEYEDYGLDITNASLIGTVHSPLRSSIINLNPDFIIYSSKISNEKIEAQYFSSIGIQCFDSTINCFEDYLFTLNQFCKITKRNDLYKTNGLDVKSRIDTIINRCPDTNNPTVIFAQARTTDVKFISSENIIPPIIKDLKAKLGIPDGITSSGGRVRSNDILKDETDIVVIEIMGSNVEQAKYYIEHYEDFTDIKAVQENKYYYLPDDLFHYKPNNRWDLAYEYMYNLFYGN